MGLFNSPFTDSRPELVFFRNKVLSDLENALTPIFWCCLGIPRRRPTGTI